MKDVLITRLEEEMRKQGFNYKSLSLAAGLGETSVRDIITRRALNPRRDTLQKIAAQLGKPLSYFLAEEAEALIPLLASLAPGEKVNLRQPARAAEVDNRKALEKVETPPGYAGGELVALRIAGNALGPVLPEGTLVYYTPASQPGVQAECLHVLCVMELVDGTVHIASPESGLLYGRYHLKTPQGTRLEDREVSWCAKIGFIKLP